MNLPSHAVTPPHSSEANYFAAMVRAYVPAAPRALPALVKRRATPPSDWVLIFDTETKIDAGLSLRFGAYQLRKSGELVEGGLFFEPAALSKREMATLQKFAALKNITLLSRAEFVDQVFDKAYDLRASIVGFNLPFDISRIAFRHNSARGKMKGGFTFQLSADPRRARIQIRHLNARASFIQFAFPPRQSTPRGARKRRIITRGRRGSFIDVKTAAAALFSRSFTLETLTAFLQTATQKHSSDDHGRQLSRRYVEYAMADVQATWECYEALSLKFDTHRLSKTHLGKILSEAGIGKAYLREMGLKPFREVQPDFPDDLLGLVMSTYYGGRTEVRWRRHIKQVLHCDFLSMYPTVCTLMKLWTFIIADGVTWKDTTEDTRQFIDEIELKELQAQASWRQLHTLVRLRPKGDILPLRARYDGVSATIGLNIVESDEPLWYTLADVVASKLLTDRAPVIEQAITFTPRAPQAKLSQISIGGDGATIDPVADDLFKRLIDHRSEIKAKIPSSQGSEKLALEAEQQALKILTNSTSYGIFVEVNVVDLDGQEDKLCFGPTGDPFSIRTDKSEEPGAFFHPLIATLITGAARLMLAIAETLTLRSGLDWAFCDTDSLAIAKPDEMNSDDFFRSAQTVADWFVPLNPYAQPGSLFKIEDVNYGLGEKSKELTPLFCLCISSKRYVLFNFEDTSGATIRSASAHGLGHLLAPYSSDDPPPEIAAPSCSTALMGVERWQHDLWIQIIRATTEDHPAEVDLGYHPAMRWPAAARYHATTPTILRWFDRYNVGKKYVDQIKPFNFLISLQSSHLGGSSSGSPGKRLVVKPVAPFSKDRAKLANGAFDRETGESVSPRSLRTYARALAQFHLSPEAKFLNGDYIDSGRTERRCACVTSIHHIGKEANNWEKQFFLGSEDDEQVDYGAHPNIDLEARVKALCVMNGERATAARLGVARETLRKFRRGDQLSGAAIGRLRKHVG